MTSSAIYQLWSLIRRNDVSLLYSNDTDISDCHCATSKIRYAASPAPLLIDEEPVSDISSFRCEVVLGHGRKKRGSFDSLSTVISNQCLGSS